MGNRAGFVEGEWYHCYSRGVDKRTVFESLQDYQRFLEILYLANSTKPFHRSNISVPREKLFTAERSKTVVSIGAYALLPNHFHLLIYEKTGSGISSFMRKLGIAYAMYFNIKNNRVGNLFVKPFRSKHLRDDRYFQHCVNYIHLNPIDLFIPGWKRQCVDIELAVPELVQYQYSSAYDFYDDAERPERAILGNEIVDVFEKRPLTDVVADAQEYHKENIKMLS